MTSAAQPRRAIGLDVGSTTVKAVVLDPATGVVEWQDYRRHETRQAETVAGFLGRIEKDCRLDPRATDVFVTGSGGAALAPAIGARFVQEVTAVAGAVRRRFPDVRSVVELGGQDAKIVIFRPDPATGRVSTTTSMNDKCAGGTGAVLDKIAAKLGLTSADLASLPYRGVRRHPVAAKCGVFAETDVNSLQKLGVPETELMASVLDAVVQQNLSVLTRGNTLLPEVLLLGGPHAFLPGLVDAWRDSLATLWQQRGVALPENRSLDAVVWAPPDALLFAALGAIEFGRSDGVRPPTYLGAEGFERALASAGPNRRRAAATTLAGSPEELSSFLDRYRRAPFVPARYRPGETVRAFVGLDGGSTSTKAVLLAPGGEVLAKSYQLSGGNPIEDTRTVLAGLEDQVRSQGAVLEVLGVGTTGYAKDVLSEAIGADVALVETVAHTRAAVRSYPEVDVICDVGGQDIKVISLRNGQVTDFRLNTQCSAGNGFFLQSSAEAFGYPVEGYADAAFGAARLPTFGYGCAVFLQTDIVDFQRQGWAPEEIMAGLAAVLPKNIWLYVAQAPNLASLGSTFVLQGGTQHNLAAVKAQVDFIERRFRGAANAPRIHVHEHCGEAGAIGCALEAIRLWTEGRRTSFIGMEAVARLRYQTRTSEDTRCTFCTNACLRTFIDVTAVQPAQTGDVPGSRRIIVGNSCERGGVQDTDSMRQIKRRREAARRASPNLADAAAHGVWRSRRVRQVVDPPTRWRLPRARRRREAVLERRASLRIGIPRVLNLYSVNPFFSAYFESLGVGRRNLVYSEMTGERMFREGIRRASVDPCFPSKVVIPHVHDLLTVQHRRDPLDVVFVPMVDALPPALTHTQASRACVTVTAAPEAAKAAFTKETDLFAELGVRYLDPLVDLSDPRLAEIQLFAAFSGLLDLTPEENARAVAVGFRELHAFWAEQREQASGVIEQLERADRLGIVLLDRPYHHDPGINHGIVEDLQLAGYPILTPESLPTDGPIVERLFGAEVALGLIRSPLDIDDVWQHTYSENTNRKLWAAKFVARHPNLVAVELSSFKCGHDAPAYATVQHIVQDAGTPYFCFKDLDENKSANSIKIRIETITYFLERYRTEVLQPARLAERAVATRPPDFEPRSGEACVLDGGPAS